MDSAGPVCAPFQVALRETPHPIAIQLGEVLHQLIPHLCRPVHMRNPSLYTQHAPRNKYSRPGKLVPYDKYKPVHTRERVPRRPTARRRCWHPGPPGFALQRKRFA